MATGGGARLRRRSKSRDVEGNGANKRTCAVCLEQYRRPKVLPCFHTYCQSCLQAVAGTAASFPCPSCRALVPVPPGGVASFQTNFYIDDDEDDADSPSLLCDVCDEDREVTHTCLQCQQRYCLPCKTTHDSIASCRDHSVVSLQTNKEGSHGGVTRSPRAAEVNGRRRSVEEMCAKHGDQRLLLHCTRCSANICLLCKLTAHEGHPTCDLVQSKPTPRHNQRRSSLGEGNDLGTGHPEAQQKEASLDKTDGAQMEEDGLSAGGNRKQFPREFDAQQKEASLDKTDGAQMEEDGLSVGGNGKQFPREFDAQQKEASLDKTDGAQMEEDGLSAGGNRKQFPREFDAQQKEASLDKTDGAQMEEDGLSVGGNRKQFPREFDAQQKEASLDKTDGAQMEEDGLSAGGNGKQFPREFEAQQKEASLDKTDGAQMEEDGLSVGGNGKQFPREFEAQQKEASLDKTDGAQMEEDGLSAGGNGKQFPREFEAQQKEASLDKTDGAQMEEDGLSVGGNGKQFPREFEAQQKEASLDKTDVVQVENDGLSASGNRKQFPREFTYSQDSESYICALCATRGNWLWVKYCSNVRSAMMKLFDENGEVVQHVNEPVAGHTLVTVLDDVTISRGSSAARLDVIDPNGVTTSVDVDMKPAYLVHGAACGYPFVCQRTKDEAVVRVKFSSKDPLKWSTDVVLKENTFGKLVDASAEEKYFAFKTETGMCGTINVYQNQDPSGFILCSSYRSEEVDARDCRFCRTDGREVLLVLVEGDDRVHVVDHADGGRFIRYLDTGPCALDDPHRLATDYDEHVWIGCHGGKIVVVKL